jgi:hypothetical protein
LAQALDALLSQRLCLTRPLASPSAVPDDTLFRRAGEVPARTALFTGYGMSDASRDSHTPAELVVHEVSDLTRAVATEPALPIEVDGYQRLVAEGHQDVSLTARIADERVTLASDRDEEIGTTLEAILADVLVQQAATHALDKVLRWMEPDEVPSH